MDILNYLHTISISFTVDNLIVLLFLILLLCILAYGIFKLIKLFLHKKFEIVNMNINIANIGSINIEKNKNISQIAHKAWVEIMTRKVGLLFEEDNDVIVEVYNSWYTMFSIIRDLLKEIEPKKRDKDFEKIEKILIQVLNYGLRPHLTKWQAQFRRWYNKEIEKPENENLTPQLIQKKYEKYNELILDLKETNKQMIQFANELKKLI